jgi:hypothetical protein
MMAGIEQVSIISTWSITHFIMIFLWIYFFLPGGNMLVPVATVEKGFIPSSAWPGENSNVSVIRNEAQ